MAFSVICISATDGALGEEVGTRVASGLGYRLVNEQIVVEAAEEAGIHAHVVADVEQRRSVVDRVIHQLLNSSASAPAPGASKPSADDMRGLIRGVIEDFGERGSAVIVSHAASHALGYRADTLRVLVTAGPQTRRDRLMAAQNVSDKEAEKRIGRGDANRADYIKRFYGVAAELPTHYDLVVNTDRLSADEAVDLVVRTASSDR
jgi:cytidylate kinase